VCVPKTCADYPVNSCGPVSDGCGGVLTNCGVGDASNCAPPAICGGGLVPGVCGGGTASNCSTGLCLQRVTCQPNVTTILSGTVVSPRTCQGAVCDSKTNPKDADPLPNIIVYIPKSLEDVPPFAPGVQCDQCGGTGTLANTVVATTTGADGKFTLSNVPV